MENQTSFNLTSALEQWRSRLAGHDCFDAAQLKELESHVREGVAEWTAKGLTELEAFGIATRRLGSGLDLAEEFGKEDGREVWRSRLFWMVVGVTAMGSIQQLMNLAAIGAVTGGVKLAAYAYPIQGFLDPSRESLRTTSQVLTWLASPFALFFVTKWGALSKTRWSGRFPCFRTSRTRLAVGLTLAFIAIGLTNLAFGFVSLKIEMPKAHLNWSNWVFFYFISPTALALLAAYAAPDRLLVKRE